MTFEEQYDPVDIEDYFAHYGRKGMKWYQHIFGEVQSHAKYFKDKRNTNKEIKRKARTLVKDKSKKNYKKFSDEELKRRIERLRNEKEYVELNKATRRNGKRITASVLNAIGKGALKVVEDQTRNVGNKLVGQMITELLKEDKDKKK